MKTHEYFVSYTTYNENGKEQQLGCVMFSNAEQLFGAKLLARVIEACKTEKNKNNSILPMCISYLGVQEGETKTS